MRTELINILSNLSDDSAKAYADLERYIEAREFNAFTESRLVHPKVGMKYKDFQEYKTTQLTK